MTGGVGFIDNSLIDNVITQDTHVTVFDNFTSGTLQNIKQWLDNPNLTFIKGKLLGVTDTLSNFKAFRKETLSKFNLRGGETF